MGFSKKTELSNKNSLSFEALCEDKKNNELRGRRKVSVSFVSLCENKQYEAFGNLVWQSGTYSDNREFTSKEKDETGFHYFPFRYYSGDIGRFLSPDPHTLMPGNINLSNPQELNPYVYCYDNPLIYIDPTGLNVVNFCQPTGEYVDYTKDDYGWDYVSVNVGETEYSLHDPNWNVKEMKAFREFMEGGAGQKPSLALNFENEVMTLALKGIEGIDNIVDVAFASKRNGPMDFAAGPNNVCTPQTGNLFMINGTIYNGYDAGNYIWGGAMGLLGYELGTAKFGAHAHNFLFDPDHRFKLDSPTDQLAIQRGYFEIGGMR